MLSNVIWQVACAYCIGYYLNVVNIYIIVETNYEAFYKMKLQNEWGTFIDLKILPVSYLFISCPLLYLGDPMDHSPFLGTESVSTDAQIDTRIFKRYFNTRRGRLDFHSKTRRGLDDSARMTRWGTITTRGWLAETRLTRRRRLNEAMTRRGWLGEVDSTRST